MASTPYIPGSLLSINGIIKELKSERRYGTEQKYVVYFILETEKQDGRLMPHEYLVKAYSNTGHDRFNIAGRVGKKVRITFYLNGQKKKTDKVEGGGWWHHNELSLHSIE
jgi:hypothetical protein